jgi:hypothetical protein
VTVLIDGGATHNFIDANIVERRGIPTKEFNGFTVVILGGHQMSCTKWSPKLTIPMGNYSMKDDFFVVDVPDTRRYTTDHRTMEMEFTGLDDKKVVLRAMHQYPPKIVSSYNMEAVMRHGDIEWVVQCFIFNRELPAATTSSITPLDLYYRCFVKLLCKTLSKFR